jgi:hydrogenase maturation factor
MSHPESTSPGEAVLLEVACTLDRDACVVCSDAGIPVRVVEVAGDDALCQDSAGNRATIAVELVSPVVVGDILLTHGGVAIGRESIRDLGAVSREDSYEVRQ